MNATAEKTCLITVVENGLPDKVIKVFPANGKAEKIWCTHTAGIERWAAVKRFLYNGAKKGVRVADPVAWHTSNDLKTPAITDADIPVVELEDGLVFEVFVEPEPVRPQQAGHPVKADQERMERLEASVERLTKLVSDIVFEGKGEGPAKRGPGRPRKEQA